MGWVYRVHHSNWNIDLAVKSPRPNYFQTETQKENFAHECETWINLGLHPHIVSCYYVRRLGGIPRVFAEYVEDGSLQDWIKSRKLYEGSQEESVERILDIAIQFAWGLQYAHEKGLIHRDVKPANVMMTPNGIAKVTDFGLAKARVAAGEKLEPESQQSILISAGGMTPAYCSPEQANQEQLSRRTDIWSWALSILEMFTGEVIWRAGAVAGMSFETYLEMGKEIFVIPMPEALAVLLWWCLQENPDDRPKEMSEIVSELRKTYRQVTGQAYAREDPQSSEILSADSLNNQAISFLDLGAKEQTEKCFDDALQANPQHPETIYNRGLFLWRSGRMTDDAVVQQLEVLSKTLKSSQLPQYLLGLVHIERGDAESAIQALKQVPKGTQNQKDVQRALVIARNGREKWRSCVQIFTAPSVSSVSFSPHGGLVLSGNTDSMLHLRDLATGQSVPLGSHADSVTSVSISPDGRWAISGSRDTTLRLWKLAGAKIKVIRPIITVDGGASELRAYAVSQDGETIVETAVTGDEKNLLVRTFEGHTDSVTSVALSPDGRWALSGSGSRDKTLRLWEVATGRCARTFAGHTAEVTSVSISPDGCWALSGSQDKTLRLWEVATGQCVQIFEGHTDAVTSVSISPDGRWGLSGSGTRDKTLRLWELATGKCVRTFEGHTDSVRSVNFSPDGAWALSGSQDAALRLWEVATGRCVRTFEGHTSGSQDAALRLWEVATGRCVRTFEGHTDVVISVSLSPKGDQALSVSADNTLRLWRLRDAGPPGRFMIAVPKTAEETIKLADIVRKAMQQAKSSLQQGRISEAETKIAEAWRLSEHQRNRDLLDLWGEIRRKSRHVGFYDGWCLHQYKGHTKDITSVGIGPDGHWALSGSSDKTLKLWDLITGQIIRTFEGHRSSVNSVSISPDGCWALSGSYDQTLKLWEVSTGQCARTFGGHTEGVTSVSFSPDGRWALSGSYDQSLKLWEVATGQCVRTFAGHTKWVTSVSFSPDGRWALSGSADWTLRLWEVATGRWLMAFQGHTDGVTAVSISPDGCWALSGSQDKTVRLWEMATGKYVKTFLGHASAVVSVCFSPDGRWGLSGGDNTLRLWALSMDRYMRTFEGRTFEVPMTQVNALSISPDGRLALSGGTDETVRVWEFVWESEFPGFADWEEGARPYLDLFLTLHCPYGYDGISRMGKPVWGDKDFEKLLKDLQQRGYGWLRPEGVRRELEQMGGTWDGPPSLLKKAKLYDAGSKNKPDSKNKPSFFGELGF